MYAPNKDKDLIQFLRELYVLFQSENLDSEENIILGGDFNCPLNPALDKRGGIMIPRRAAIDSIESLQTGLDLVDICRLDFWLISNNLCDFVNSTKILLAIRTDHAAITLALGEIGEMKGPGIWKMNVSLLDDENYLNQLRINIPKWKLDGENELSDNRSVWDCIKYNIRSHAISYSKQKAKHRNENERQIQQEFEEATRLFENDPSASNRGD